MPPAMLRAVRADIQRIADGGVHAAEQATMTLDALSTALGRKARRSGRAVHVSGASVGIPPVGIRRAVSEGGGVAVRRGALWVLCDASRVPRATGDAAAAKAAQPERGPAPVTEPIRKLPRRTAAPGRPLRVKRCSSTSRSIAANGRASSNRRESPASESAIRVLPREPLISATAAAARCHGVEAERIPQSLEDLPRPALAPL